MGFISPKGLQELKNYQYRSGGYSWLDNKINPFWIACVECLPMWIAPNLLTFIGFMFMLVSCTIGLITDPSLNETIPRWIFLFNGVSILVYQTLDAIDGKQARRTKSSSPLGQLFDHGCDSFSMTFFVLQVAQAAKIPCEDLFYISLGNQIMLWGANQREHLTGVMHTHLYNIGVTEVELLCSAIQFISWIFGPDVWHTSISNYFNIYSSNWIMGIILNFKIFILVEGPMMFFYFCFGVYVVIINVKDSQNKMKCILEWIYNGTFWWLQFVWFNQEIYRELAGAIILNFGIITSLIVCKIIICSTTKDVFPTFHLESLPFLIVTLIIHFSHPSKQIVRYLFILNFIISVILCIRFLYIVINQITDYLGIYCFSIKPITNNQNLQDNSETQALK